MAHNSVKEAREVLEQAWRTSIENRLGFQADLIRAYGTRALGVALKDPRVGLDWVRRGPDYQTTCSLFDNPSHLVAIHALMGEFDQASQVLEELQSRLRVLRQPIFGLWPDELGLLWIRQGEWRRAEAQLTEAVDWAANSGNRAIEAATAQKLGELHMLLGEYDDAERYLVRALDLSRRSVSRVSELTLLPSICELHLRKDNLVAATETLIQAKSIAGEAEDWGALMGDVWIAEGLVCAASDQWHEADVIFGMAVQVFQDYGLPWDEARAFYEWGASMVGQRQDRSRMDHAEDLLRKALDLWEPMGASAHAVRCRAMLEAPE
ncbi:MAG: tetratricopeptide repeat protein [Dehalococcoidia bacterium]|nr:tetratricopeptide repeat protein [Dehalococcoidia bacterium]